MSELNDLLIVQHHDTTLDQLRHKRAHLADRTTLTDIEKALVALQRDEAAVAERRHGLARDQKRLEDEIASLDAKIASNQRKLETGTVPKELQALTSDQQSLGARKSALEDDVLELMESSEALDVELAAFAERRSDLDGQAAVLRVAIAEAESSIDADIARETAERVAAAALVSASALAQYDKMRGKLAGVAIAELVRNHCSGCSLELSAFDLGQLKAEPVDALTECPHCGRLLVRS
ncbi:MAG: zinc ribbon domain-containing protein [Acidimicrobiia bacterium]